MAVLLDKQETGASMNGTEKKVCEMQEVRIVVEHIHVYRYPKWRVRMPKVFVRVKPQKSRGRWAYRIWTQVACAVAAAAVAFEVYIILLPIIHADRMGQAIGGEWMVMALVGLATYCILSRLLDKRKGEGQ